MLYTENKTLFSLHAIDIEALELKIKKSKKNFTLNIGKVEDFLKIIQMESKVSNKSDFDTIFSLYVSNANRPMISLTIEPQKNLLPHLSYIRKKLILEVEIEDFNSLPVEALVERSFSKYTNRSFSANQPIICDKGSLYILKVLSKIDSIFKTNNEFYTAIYNKGIYIEKIKLKCNTFNITYATSSLTVESIANKYTKTGVKKSLVTISAEFNTWQNIDETTITIEVYNQLINLTYLEFINASHENLEAAILSILRLKSMEVNSLEDFKHQLLIHEMINQ